MSLYATLYTHVEIFEKETYLKRIKKKQKSIIYLKLEFCSIKYRMLKKDQLENMKKLISLLCKNLFPCKHNYPTDGTTLENIKLFKFSKKTHIVNKTQTFS